MPNRFKSFFGVLIAVSLLATGSLAGVAAAGDNPMEYKGEARIAAQTVNETIVLAWMAKLMVDEYTSLETEINTSFVSENVLHQAMKTGEIDIYPGWTGTQLTGVLRYEGPNLTPEEAFAYVKKGFEDHFGFTWSQPVGFNNTYVMSVRKETAEKYGLQKASDLSEYAGEWILGGDENFDTRPDAYPGWSEAYGIEFDDVLPMQYAMIYRAIADEEVEVIAAYSTDPRIKKLDLVMLEDDKKFFPDYHAAYIVDMRFLEKYPAVIDILNKLEDTIDEKTMSGLNGRYDEGEPAEDLAREFLTEAGLIGN